MRNTLYALAGGLLLGAGFVAPPLWPLALTGLAPIVHALSRAQTWLRAFFIGWFSGIILYACVCFAIFWHALPLDWLGNVFPQWFQVFFIALAWIMTSAGLALGSGLFGAIVYHLASRSWHDIFIIPAAWVIGEWVSMWEFSIQNIGEGSVLGAHFGLGQIGNALAHDLALLQIAWLGGPYLLSFAAAASGIITYQIIRKPLERKALGLLGIALFVLWILAHVILTHTPNLPPNEKGVRVALISTQNPPIFYPSVADREENLNTILKLLPETRGADIVVLPESTGFLAYLAATDPRFRDTISALYDGAVVPLIIDSETTRTHPRFLQSQLEYYDIMRRESQRSLKYFLLPGGEYLPYLYSVLIPVFGQGDALDEILEHRGLRSGKYPAVHNLRGVPVATLFCNETLSPSLYSSLAENGAQMFVNVASHSWFHGSRIVAEQMLTVAKVRAVESRRWYVQSSDVAPSFVLDPLGRIATSTSWGSASVIQADIQQRPDPTPYTSLASWVLLLCTGILLLRALQLKSVRQ